MSELAKLYEVLKSATVAQVLAFAALIFPGLVALRAYEAKRGGEPRKTNEVLVDILGYSLIADLIGEALLIAANAVPQPIGRSSMFSTLPSHLRSCRSPWGGAGTRSKLTWSVPAM
jgi:hypothetical protein